VVLPLTPNVVTDSLRPAGDDCNVLQAAGQANYQPGNRQRENIVALSVRYSYHGSMTFWVATKRCGHINPLSQLKAALRTGMVVT
jgi:hypothetical protein